MTAKVNTSASAITGNSGGSAANNKKKKAADPCTLFVKFTPPSANITRQHLSNYFSYWGPVNKCSVIRNKQAKYQQQQQQQHDGDGGEDDNNNNNNTSGDRGSKGYGFVRFVNEEDAISAANANDIKSYNHNNKKKNSKNVNNSNGEEFMVVEGVQYKIHAERAVDASSATASSANNTSQQQQQHQKKKEKEIANKVTPPPNNKVIKSTAAPSSSSSSSLTTTAAPIDADTLYKKESKRKRTSRVIIRNLSFYANATHVKTIMERNFGPVSAVDLPLVPDIISQSSPKNNNDDDSNSNNTNNNNNKKKNPRHRGFAFVTFTNSNAAKLAVEHTGSEIMIKNRVVAIDFSVSKAEHQKMMREDRERGKNDDDDSDSESDSENESDSDSDSENGEKTEEKVDGNSSDSGSEDDSSDSSDSDSDNDDSESEDEDEHDKKTATKDDTSAHEDEETSTPPQFDDGESKRTLFLRNVPFDATRHDVFELFRTFGRIQAVYLVKDRVTGVFKGTAFVRFENEEGCMAAMEASGAGEKDCDDQQQHFVSSKNMAMSGGGASSSSLTLKGRAILIDLAVDRTTASSLAIQRDEEGKPIKKMVGKDRRNIYLKNEGRVSSSTDSGHAQEASAKHGGMWEDLPPSDRAKRERAFADKSTKLRSPLFFINPTRISVRNLAKHITEAQLKTLVFGALKTGLKEGLVTPKDAVSHWRAGGELPHAEVMRRATDPKLVTPPLDEKNMKEAIPSLYIDRDVSGGKKTADAPSRGFGFVEFTHHIHALAVLRQLNNNPMYSSEYAAGGKHASEMSKQKRGKKKKGGKSKAKVDPETGDEFLSEDGKVVVPRLIVEFAVENKAKARQQAEKVAQKKANKIKQRIEKKEKQKEQSSEKKNEKKKGRGALQREKKRARKEAGEEDDTDTKKDADENVTKKQKLDTKTDKIQEKKPKMVKPKKKRKVDADEEVLEDMIRSYKSTFSQASESTGKGDHAESKASEPKKRSREEVVKKRWFE